MPALRKLRVGYPELCDPLGLESSPPDIRTSLKKYVGTAYAYPPPNKDDRSGMEYFYWYTHFVGKGSYWRDAFYPAPRRQFQQPRRRYYTHTSEPSELYLHVFDPYEAHIEPNIFHFPALKTLVFGTRVLSRRHSHLLMQATPPLERLYLVNCFPAVLTDVGQLIWESGDLSEGHLKKYLPNLRQLLPRGDEYKGLLTEHAESIVRSGWLQGPWKNGPVCVELIWLPR